eukprot:451437-Alexandrium_andersonii.AAC.1
MAKLSQRCQALWLNSYKGAWTFGRALTKVPGPLAELVHQRCQDLWLSSYAKGARTFGRARTKAPGPLAELVQRRRALWLS